MALKFIPARGIELSLDEYTKLRAFQGGGWFWDHESQQVIRDSLGEFLPRVEEHSDPNGALFQHFAGGTEVASKSRAVGQQMDRVPKSQLDRLQRAVEALKRKTQDAKTDPNARQIIERFRLPDPAKDPELYRLYGSPWNRKLLVLWGCERESGTSLAPFSALSKMPVEPVTATWLRRLPLLVSLLLLLLLLAALIITLLPKREDRTRVAETAPSQSAGTPASMAPVEDLPNRRPDVALAPSEGSQSANPSPANPTVAPSSPPVGPSRSTAPSASVAAAVEGVPSATPPAELARSAGPALASTGSSQFNHEETHAGQSRPRPFADAAPSSSASPSPSASASTPASLAPLRNTTPKKPGVIPPIRDHSPPKMDEPDPSTALNPSPSPAASPALADTPQGSPATAAGRTAGNPANAVSPLTEPSPLLTPSTPPELEIIKARSAASAEAGKVDALLIATAHGRDGAAQTVKVTHWKVDGALQLDAARKPITTEQLNTSLTPGKHRVSVLAMLASGGVAMEAEFENGRATAH